MLTIICYTVNITKPEAPKTCILQSLTSYQPSAISVRSTCLLLHFRDLEQVGGQMKMNRQAAGINNGIAGF